ncbi:MAG: hypothetical protein IKU29_03970 [Parabacteroides sp.]|nr:hypothetical protein [Parabacteroides sp.]
MRKYFRMLLDGEKEHVDSLIGSINPNLDVCNLFQSEIARAITPIRFGFETSVIDSLIDTALEMTKCQITTSIDRILHFGGCTEYKMIYKKDDGYFAESPYYVSHDKNHMFTEISFRNINNNIYQTIYIGNSVKYGFCTYSPFGKPTFSSAVIFYNEFPRVVYYDYEGRFMHCIYNYYVKNSLFETHKDISKNKKDAVNLTPLFTHSDECPFVCNDEEFAKWIEYFIDTFLNNFNALKNDLIANVSDPLKQTDICDIIDDITANDIARLYSRKINEMHVNIYLNDKSYVEIHCSKTKVSELYDTWFKDTLNKRNRDAINDVFNGTLGEFCEEYSIEKLVKCIKTIGHVKANEINEIIKRNTSNILCLKKV